MKLIRQVSMLQDEVKKISEKKNDLTVGFIPTMGALHDGHKALIETARDENGIVIVSIFVNPTQFLEGEDFSKYPRTLENDLNLLKELNIDILFLPSAKELYFSDEIGILAPKIRGYILEGKSRVGHFNGVLQVVLKLFMLTKPHRAYFGKKDAQQLILIKQMVKNLFLDIEIIGIDTVREENGLALSSRNRYLSDEEKTLSLNISKSLEKAKTLIQNGEKNINEIQKNIAQNLQGLKVEYISIKSQNLTEINSIEKNNTLILIAVKIGTTRLIDNLWI